MPERCAMKAQHLAGFWLLSLSFIIFSTCHSEATIQRRRNQQTIRRILHEPLFPESSVPPSTPSPPPPLSPSFTDPDQPFFPEVPSGTTSQQQSQQPPPVVASNGTAAPFSAATQPPRQTTKVAIAISVGIVTLGMLSALAFFLYRHRTRHSLEKQKFVGGSGGAGNSDRLDHHESRLPPPPPPNFLYVGTVEPSNSNGSPYHKLNPSSVKRSERYRPSPELQPLPPLPRQPPQTVANPSPVSALPSDSSSSLDDEERHDAVGFHTSRGSSVSNGESSYYTPKQQSYQNPSNLVAQSKRTSPKSRLSSSSPEMKNIIIPSIKQSLPPLPPPKAEVQDNHRRVPPSPPKRTKFSPPPPPPPLPSIAPPLRLPTVPAAISPGIASPSRATTSDRTPSGGSSERQNTGDDSSEGRPKLKPLHWDKVRATSDRATVWDHLKSSSFQLNEEMMESLFGCNSNGSAPKEAIRQSVLPPQLENIVLDPKKSQNIAILLRALNVTRDEVCEALLDGNPEGLGAELLETLVKMAPTKEEEIKLRAYNGDLSKLGTAERFLKTILDIPFAFKRVEAMLYRANFDTEVNYLRQSFQNLKTASEELKNSRLFLKLLEAVLRTGNRMNLGTNRGDATSFKLDTLLKLVDIKGTDGKTTLLHFVVQEIIRSSSDDVTWPPPLKEDEFRKQGLQVVAGLGRDLIHVKKAAAMDSDVLNSYVSKLELGLEKVQHFLQQEKLDGTFMESMKIFKKEAAEEIAEIKSDERTVMKLVKEVTQYFHGDAAKEEAHPLRIFMIVRDFLSVLDHVCKDVSSMHDRTAVGSARSFRISSTASLPVLNRYNGRDYRSYG